MFFRHMSRFVCLNQDFTKKSGEFFLDFLRLDSAGDDTNGNYPSGFTLGGGSLSKKYPLERNSCVQYIGDAQSQTG